MIKLQNITRRYGEKTVIENLSHIFPDKGIFALMGPSGCGKTTLLRLLADLDKPNSGELESTHQKTAVAFQEPRLLPWLNCKDNLKLVLSKDEQSSKFITETLSALELDEVANARPSALSGGMQQRLSLARALVFSGDLLLLDEPFSALDEALKARIAPLIKKAAERALVIMVTHSESDAALLGATVLHCEGIPLSALAQA